MANQFQTITDANGKTFQVDVSKICDINGDAGPIGSNVQDSAIRNRINFEHDTKIVDSKGNDLDPVKLVNDINNGKSDVVALDVDMEATHSGKNHNYCIYYEDSMEKDAESFMNPFHKPMLKNHDDYSEPLGRVTQSYLGPSELTDERSAIHLRTRVTDKDSIPKFIDKRYGTVSIGGSMGTVTCNICGKTILKDGKFHFCGHWKGETYKDQICYWGARDIEYHEVSVVNNPADDFAQIMKVTVLTDKDIANDSQKEDKSMGSDSNDTKTTNVDNLIDQTLGTTTDTTDTNQNQQTTDSNDTNTTADTTATPDPDTQATDSTKTDATTATDTTDADASVDNDAKVKELEAQLADANKKIADLEAEAIDAQSQITELNKAIDEAKKDNAIFKDRCIALATANKEIIVDNLLANKKFDTEDAKKEEKQNLMTKSMKELKAMQSEDSAKPAVHTTATVPNPNLADNKIDDLTKPDKTKDSSNSDKDADTDKVTDNQKVKTVDDATQEILARLFK